ncbi:hypothetical protein PR048_013655 [Dryococelus australis]|uniref:Uncharacterized protein n=1 Tax=Dryococelus australis TaxID=614101 RepID=A0ABQ9HTL0_9NEOP|nr:hypothetical protein PR048_013655 [Dryococelus australis]
MAGFPAATGIWPYHENVFDDSEFVLCEVTESPNPHLMNSSHSSVPQLSSSQIDMHETSGISEENQLPNVLNNSDFSPEIVRPRAKTNISNENFSFNSKNRRKCKTAILTRTPEKNDLEEEQKKTKKTPQVNQMTNILVLIVWITLRTVVPMNNVFLVMDGIMYFAPKANCVMNVKTASPNGMIRKACFHYNSRRIYDIICMRPRVLVFDSLANKRAARHGLQVAGQTNAGRPRARAHTHTHTHTHLAPVHWGLPRKKSVRERGGVGEVGQVGNTASFPSRSAHDVLPLGTASCLACTSRPFAANSIFKYASLAITGAAAARRLECNVRGETGDPREDPPTSGILRHDSTSENPGTTPPGCELGSPRWAAS